jgi:hypothetical protein
MAAARTEGFVYEMFLSNRVGQMVEQSLKHHEDARRPTRKPLNKLAQIFKFHTFQFLSTKNNSTCSMYSTSIIPWYVREGTSYRAHTCAMLSIHA